MSFNTVKEFRTLLKSDQNVDECFHLYNTHMHEWTMYLVYFRETNLFKTVPVPLQMIQVLGNEAYKWARFNSSEGFSFKMCSFVCKFINFCLACSFGMLKKCDTTEMLEFFFVRPQKNACVVQIRWGPIVYVIHLSMFSLSEKDIRLLVAISWNISVLASIGGINRAQIDISFFFTPSFRLDYFRSNVC